MNVSDVIYDQSLYDTLATCEISSCLRNIKAFTISVGNKDTIANLYLNEVAVSTLNSYYLNLLYIYL